MNRLLIVSRMTEKPVYVSCQCIQASPWRKPPYRPVYPIGTRGSSILLFRHSHHLLLTFGTAPTPTRTSQIVCCLASYMPHLLLLGIEGFVGIELTLECLRFTHSLSIKLSCPKCACVLGGDVDDVHWCSHQHHLCPFSRHLLKAE